MFTAEFKIKSFSKHIAEAEKQENGKTVKIERTITSVRLERVNTATAPFYFSGSLEINGDPAEAMTAFDVGTVVTLTFDVKKG